MQVKVNGTKASIGPARLCYVSVFTKKKFDGDDGEGKYMTNILIPKDDEAAVAAIRKAIKAAYEEAVASPKKWGGKRPKDWTDPLMDGDDKEDPGEFAGHYYLNAKSGYKPMLVDKYRQPITDPDELYSGVWGVVSVTFYGYKTGKNTGVGTALNGVMKYKDGDRIGGGGSVSDFDGFDADDDDDDDEM